MIAYTDNGRDNTLKPCTKDIFDRLVHSRHTQTLIQEHRSGIQGKKQQLPAFLFQGVLHEERYREHLEQCRAEGTRPKGSRQNAFMRPNGLVMIDVDHEPQPRERFARMMRRLGDMRQQQALALAHVTPGGEGLRLVLARPEGMSIEQSQRHWAEALDTPYDTVCKDLARCSFCPMAEDMLWRNDELLFGDIPEAWLAAEALCLENTPMRPATAAEPGKKAARFPTEHRGLLLKDIVLALQQRLGGEPKEGERNIFLLKMAQHMAYLCDRNPDWLMELLPRYGQEAAEFCSTVQSACAYPYNRAYHQTVDSVMESLRGVCGALPMPAMPEADALPQSIRTMLQGTPEMLHPALAMGVFPALAAHLVQVKFVYANKRESEPAFMNLLVAGFGSGKSAMDHPLDCILASIVKRDNENRARLDAWKQQCQSMGNSKDKPRRPDDCPIQVILPNTTQAAFTQLLWDAKGHTLYTMMPELDMLKRLNSNGKDNMEVIRLAYDRKNYGQERVGVDAVCKQALIRWNWNASSTPQQALTFFRNELVDGTLSRLTLSTITREKDDWGASISVYDNYTEEYERSMQPYLALLQEAKGTYDLDEAKQWAARTQARLAALAQRYDDRPYASLAGRAVLSGFWRAMVLYLMEGGRWTGEIEEFASWSVEYDLWCKMHFFGTGLRRAMEGESAVPCIKHTDMLATMPATFRCEDLCKRYEAMGKDPALAKGMLRQWVCRRRVTYDEQRQVYTKAA